MPVAGVFINCIAIKYIALYVYDRFHTKTNPLGADAAVGRPRADLWMVAATIGVGVFLVMKRTQ